MFLVKVTVKQTAKKLSDPDDRQQNPKGEHIFFVEARNKKEAKERALDRFHLEVPVGCLDDFDISAEVPAKEIKE